MQEIYSIKDKSMGHYQVFMASNEYGAMRYCADLVYQKDTFYNKHHEDLELFKVGDFDTDSGIVKPESKFITNFTKLLEI